MYKKLLILAAMAGCAQGALAQDRIYRCGNEYTNDLSQARSRNCKLIEGGNVTVVQGTRPSPAASGAAPKPAASTPRAAAPAPASAKANTAEQRARESDARMILESELRKAEARKAELQREYNNGEPQKNALEMRNPAFYNQRISDMKTEMTRVDSDIAGIQRELSRLPAPSN
ncbi:MAG: hypothetical protein ACN6O3_07010 [Comamonas sp.]